jgi:hypothetical protein
MNPDEIAKNHGWLILQSGEAYEKVYASFERWEKEKRGDKETMVLKHQSSNLYIFREGNQWELWRATHKSGVPSPISERTLRRGKDFKRIIEAAESFIEWCNIQKKKKSSPRETASKEKVAN